MEQGSEWSQAITGGRGSDRDSETAPLNVQSSDVDDLISWSRGSQVSSSQLQPELSNGSAKGADNTTSVVHRESSRQLQRQQTRKKYASPDADSESIVTLSPEGTWYACIGLSACRICMFVLGGIATCLLVRWQCGELLGEVASQADLDEQEKLQGAQHRLLEELQLRVNSLQLRRHLLKLQAEPGTRPTAADAHLHKLYCQTIRRSKGSFPSRLPRQGEGEGHVTLQELTDVIKRLEDSASVQMIYGDIIRYNEVQKQPLLAQALTRHADTLPTLQSHASATTGSALRHAGLAGRHSRSLRPQLQLPWQQQQQQQQLNLQYPHAGGLQHRSWQARHPRRLSSRCAFIMMAHDGPHDIEEHLWGVLPMARALQRLSSYPLVILTNKSRFLDGTDVVSSLRKLNAFVHPIREVDMPAKLAAHKMTPTWKIAYWKLQIWTLTEYEKLVWLDSDAIIYRSLDWLFQRNWMWAQRDDWFCKLNQTGVCSGIMLVFPNQADFEGLLQYAETKQVLPGGDQQLITEYFARTNRPISLLSDLEASFGQCLGKAPTPYLNPDGKPVWGVWSVPSFVHKSGGWENTNNNVYNNVCFNINMTRQHYRVGKTVVNICQFHPLGAYWRDLFCDAAAQMGLRLVDIGAYCNDACWYRGVQPPGPGGSAAEACGPLNATLGSDAYYGRSVGWPQPEEPSFVV